MLFTFPVVVSLILFEDPRMDSCHILSCVVNIRLSMYRGIMQFPIWFLFVFLYLYSVHVQCIRIEELAKAV